LVWCSVSPLPIDHCNNLEVRNVIDKNISKSKIVASQFERTMIMLVGDETRQHCLEDTAMDVLATSVIDVVDRVGLLAMML
jgi:hypothetical protein